MGLEAGAIIGIVNAVVGVAAGVDASRKQKQAASDQKEAEQIARNEQKAQESLNRRAQIREERIRRSQIMQQAQNMGAAGSSGESGAISSLSSSIGANLSSMKRGQRTADSMSYFAQSAQDNIDSANKSLAYGETAQSWLNAGGDAYGQWQENKAKNTPKTKVTPVQPV